MFFIIVQFSYETLASWHWSLHDPLLHKDHSALFSTPSPEQDFRQKYLSLYVILMIFVLLFKYELYFEPRKCNWNDMEEVKDNLKLSVQVLCMVFWLFWFPLAFYQHFCVFSSVSKIHSCFKTHCWGQAMEVTCKEELSSASGKHLRNLPCCS